ncbi:hypothetical protein M9434_005468 [Picochlorum sp. BPE23]|nr:hypothetical protein M9434_005468 [Picochlorum sp. BPE23]
MKDSSKKHTKKGNKRHKNTLHSVRSHAGKKKRSVLQSFKEKLQGSKFRWLNEVLYTRSGDEAMVLLRENPELYREYHQGFREQTKQWPERPVDKAIEWLSKRPEEWKVLDLGCGDAEISRRARQENIQNFDLSSSAPNVTVCNIASLPLEDESVDAAIFCLSLMGTDYGSFIEEAMRVLKEKGWLWIAEVQIVFLADRVFGASVHTAFPAECGQYFVWQSLGMVYSHRKAGQPGPLTRIVSCTEEQWDQMPEEDKSLVNSHVAPSYTHHPRTGDIYPAYNKPVAVIDFLARTDVKEDYVLIIDADMIIRRPFVPEELGASKGWAISAHFGYMKGVANELADTHIPEVHPREDSLAGPIGRKSDDAGGFTLMSTQDLRRVAPMWLKFTEDVRADPEAWHLTGDAYSKKPGDKPWISEMYGYSFACAKANVWHKTPQSLMLYPGYATSEPPHVLHYGLLWQVHSPEKEYSFDKHWHFGFDPFMCPPWNLEEEKPKGGIFPHPPRPSSFKTKGAALLSDLLSVEVPITLNAALCERHRSRCMRTPQLEKECSKVDEYEEELESMLSEVLDVLPDSCTDSHTNCQQWAKQGECDSNSAYMLKNCRKSCKLCITRRSGLESQDSSVIRAFELNEQDRAVEESDQTFTHTPKRHTIKIKPILDAFDSKELHEQEQHQQVQHQQEQQQQEQQQQEQQQQEQQQQVQQQQVQQQQVQQQQQDGEAQDAEKDASSSTNNMQMLLETKIIPELKARCKKFPSWTSSQVERCISFAEDGIEYDPQIFDIDDDDDFFSSSSGSNYFNLGTRESNAFLPSGRTLLMVLVLGGMVYSGSKIINKNKNVQSMLLKFKLKRKNHHIG